MTTLSDFFRSEIVFWAAWVIIPVIMEIIPTIFNFFILLKRRIEYKKKLKGNTREPEVAILIPVYNSQSTLRACIESVYLSDYPKDKMNVILANNMTQDESFKVYTECQNEFPELHINWINSDQGKSKALNLAIFNSEGEYIIHIDSDGVLEKSAIRNTVNYLDKHPDVQCVTGTVLTNTHNIDKTKGFFLRLFQKMEFGEYCQAFLSGRNFQSELNSIFTLSGAFSGFRKSSIMKTRLYNFDTLCEDTHVTFQIRDVMDGKVALCSDAIFFVDPIESPGKLYVQRQRWQIGELEVLHMFRKRKDMRLGLKYITDFVIRLVVFDHTFAFPRMIWYFALLALALINYPLKLIVVSVIILFFLYSIANFLLYLCINLFLVDFDELRHYYARKWYLIFLLPIFNFITFWFRFAGIINSTYTEERSWSTRNFAQERSDFRKTVEKDMSFITRIVSRIRKEVNSNET